MRILFVCSGNTCRSPLAAFLARKIAQGYGDDVASKFSFASAGTGAADGLPASEHARALASEMADRPGQDLAAHRSSALTAAHVEQADLILTMTSAHRRAVERLVPQAIERTFTLKEYAAHARRAMQGKTAALPGDQGGTAGANGSHDIADPFGGDLETYRQAAAEIEAELRDVLAWLVAERQHGHHAGPREG